MVKSDIEDTNDMVARRRMQNRIAQRLHRKLPFNFYPWTQHKLPPSHLAQVVTFLFYSPDLKLLSIGDRCQRNASSTRKRDNNMLTWTQPHTIPSPPTKSKDNKRTRQEQQPSPPQTSNPENHLQGQLPPLDQQLITQQWSPPHTAKSSPPHTAKNSPPHEYQSPLSRSGSQSTLPPTDQLELQFPSSKN
jgi:hypothetical protein